VKIALTLFCSLLLILGQGASASMPVVGIGQVKKDCGCGGRMSCCRQASVPQPLTATAPASSQNQILSPVPAAVIWVLASAGTASISPTVSPSLSTGAAPIFARDCARLI
jgi:hypothetical protein